ncbi:MAG: dihydrofolate reductase [Sedimenticolaceae bacterium]|jgi:dihydrofolate reductase
MKPLSNLSIIAALSDNLVIGRDNRLPWRMPADLAHFKRLTMGKPIIMGRRTWESLPGLLPYRTHIVVTRDRDYVAEGGFVVHSIEEAFRFAGDAEEMMVIGGADLYAQTLPLASRMYLTLIHEQIDGDTRFPDYPEMHWREVSRESHAGDDRNPHAYSFVELERC